MILNVIVIGVGGLLIQRQLMSFADLVAFTLYVGAFLSPIQKLANFVEQYSAGMAGFTRFAELMALEPEIVDAPDAVTFGDVKGDIKFEDVSFAYKEGQTILNNISLDIPAGSTLALVGPSGGGKTTLCHLIPRFYDVISGRITLDGIDIAKIKLSSLRASIGIVQQDVFLFAGSIYDNIRYGRIDASEEEVIAAARQAEIHDFITGLADGYLTEVGERGIQLSGGQKQRVSIARIFLKNPPVLILDEATSALDTETESRIQASLDRLSAGRTTLVIAHRLTTVRHADSIVVIDEEGIRERGTHAELLARGGTYARLCRTAFRRDEQDGQDEKAALSAGMLINDTADPTACAVAEMEKTDAGTA
ncbi:MAG: ABC transporter ATP-binding protein [Saccharofermentanales bacterium]